jgi:signal transduction histidine kinase
LLALINDFLDLSRIESGRMELVNQPISPTKLVDKWKTQVGVLAEQKKLEFVIEIDPQLPPEILGDEDALSKIAVNLLSNAFKFTSQGQVSLNLARQEETWSIEVTDTGIGIPPHAREYIFEEFRQVDGSSKRQFGGTGLGLAIVQKLARLMGGNVSLKSEMGKGSTFTVVLPLQAQTELA